MYGLIVDKYVTISLPLPRNQFAFCDLALSVFTIIMFTITAWCAVRVESKTYDPNEHRHQQKM